MVDCLESLLKICQVLGVVYDDNYLSSLGECEKMLYLLDEIYKFLGGE